MWLAIKYNNKMWLVCKFFYIITYKYKLLGFLLFIIKCNMISTTPFKFNCSHCVYFCNNWETDIMNNKTNHISIYGVQIGFQWYILNEEKRMVILECLNFTYKVRKNKHPYRSKRFIQCSPNAFHTIRTTVKDHTFCKCAN